MSVIEKTEAVDYEPGPKVERRIRELGLAKGVIGLVGFRGILPVSMPYGVVDHWRKALRGARFTDASDILADARLVKSPEELKWFRRGAALTDMAFEALEKKARTGMSEFELAALISGAYVPRGGSPQLIFVGSTSMARPRLIFPNQFPSHRKIRKGDVVLTELSADYEMHPGQAHRPISVGAAPTAIYRKLYEVAVEAYERIFRALRPGATHEDVRRAGAVIQEEGFTTFDATFHGWGLLIENPRIDVDAALIKRPQNEITFREGMLMVIQPNVCTMDGKRGLQAGNLVEITRDGGALAPEVPHEVHADIAKREAPALHAGSPRGSRWIRPGLSSKARADSVPNHDGTPRRSGAPRPTSKTAPGTLGPGRFWRIYDQLAGMAIIFSRKSAARGEPKLLSFS